MNGDDKHDHQDYRSCQDSNKKIMSSSQKETLELHDGSTIEIIPRHVVIPNNNTSITVWEQNKPASLIEDYWNRIHQNNDDKLLLDPFGLVMWPGSIVAAQELLQRLSHVANEDDDDFVVLVLGAGIGVEVQAAASALAKKRGGRVIATDVHSTTLQLLKHGVEKAGLSHLVSTQIFDLTCPDEILQDCHVVVAADVLYNPKLGMHLGRHVEYLLRRKCPPKILVTDSQRFAGTDFVPTLRKKLQSMTNTNKNQFNLNDLEWQTKTLSSFTGSGVLVDEDQTYDVDVRVLSLGW